jgi:hypothetical protein
MRCYGNGVGCRVLFINVRSSQGLLPRGSQSATERNIDGHALTWGWQVCRRSETAFCTRTSAAQLWESDGNALTAKDLRPKACTIVHPLFSEELKGVFHLSVLTSRRAIYPHMIDFVGVDRVPFRLETRVQGSSTFGPDGTGHLANQTTI